MVEILRAGLYTSIQDIGRYHMAHLGVPLSGAMDTESALSANIILGNDAAAALIECTILGPQLQFSEPIQIAITGARVPCLLNDKVIDQDCAVDIKANDVLHFNSPHLGVRFYIAVKGGWKVPILLGSTSTCITSGILSLLKKGDTIGYETNISIPSSSISIQSFIMNHAISVLPGPEFAKLGFDATEKMHEREFTIHHHSNRMAYRIEEKVDFNHNLSMLSGPTLPGTVQLTPNGGIIILMRDCQTTGGYPRVAQLTEKSICHLAQLKAGDKFRFSFLHL